MFKWDQTDHKNTQSALKKWFYGKCTAFVALYILGFPINQGFLWLTNIFRENVFSYFDIMLWEGTFKTQLIIC